LWRGECRAQPFALTLPADLAPGDYQVRVALGPSFSTQITAGSVEVLPPGSDPAGEEGID
jgi:hypothetical protein